MPCIAGRRCIGRPIRAQAWATGSRVEIGTIAGGGGSAPPRRGALQAAESGGPCRIRTCDFDLVTIALYQLS